MPVKLSYKENLQKTTPVNDVMTTGVITAKLTDTAEQAMTVMSEMRIRHLPVVDNGKVIGMLSIGDVVKETIDYQHRLIKQLESYITG